MNRTIAPKFSQAKSLNLIFPHKIECSNGVEIYWIKDVKDQSVKLDVEWNAGTKFQNKKLVAGFTNKLLLAGTHSKSANKIAEEVDYFGGYTHQEVDKDHAAVTLFGLSNNIHNIFELFVDAFSNADFPEKELEKERRVSASKFKIDIEKGKVLCRREFNKNLYGENTSYGQLADYEDFAQLSRVDLLDFYKEYYLTKPVIFLTGNVDDQFIELLKGWAESFTLDPKANFEQNFIQSTGRINIKKEGAIQTAIRVGRLMFDKNHQDYYQFQILNTILGGYFGSRLMTNIREDKGYTYGIGSGMSVLQDAAYFFITTEVGKDVKEQTIVEINNELNRLVDELITNEELTRVKNYMLGDFLREADGPSSQMEIFKNIYFNELPLDYYQSFIKTVHLATPQSLKQIAKRYFDKSKMLEVVVG